MPGYSDVDELLHVADSFGEDTVIRDVARRAGLLWTCVNPQCRRDNTGRSRTCECGWPDPFPPE